MATSPETKSNSFVETRTFAVRQPAETRVAPWMWQITDSFKQGLRPNPDYSLLAHYLNNNTPGRLGGLVIERPLSTYYSLGETELIVEMGQVRPDGTGKLHDYLRQQVDYWTRVQKQGYHLTSGHFAKTNYGPIALIDSLYRECCAGLDQRHRVLVATFLGHNILPVGGDGYPVLGLWQRLA